MPRLVKIYIECNFYQFFISKLFSHTFTDVENSLFVRYLLFCGNFDKSVSQAGYNLFRSSFLWRYLAANELDCWMCIDKHMDLSSSFLKKLHAQDETQLQTVRFYNCNGETLTKMFEWALTDHVPKKLQVNGTFSLVLDDNNVSDLYGRASRVSSFKDTFTLHQVLDGFELLSSGT